MKLPSGREVGLVDVPGHERFIKNMLAGVGAINATLFVVAANEGWMPQSQEHLDILDLLGVSSAVVALTKADLVDEATLGEAASQVRDRTSRTTLAGCPIVAVSSVTGQGLEELRGEIETVLAHTPPAEDRGRPRLWIDRVFSMKGSGTVVTGTLTGGGLERNQEVELLPDGLRARIRNIQSHRRQVARLGTEMIAPGTVLYTDGDRLYNDLPDVLHITHERIVISAAADPAHVLLPGVHRVASLLERWLAGTLHYGQSTAHLDYYLDEFAFRFNRRTSRSRGLLFYRLLQQAANTDPHPLQELIGAEPDYMEW